MGEEAIPEANKPALPNCCQSLAISDQHVSQMPLTNREEERNLYSRKMLRFIPHIHSAQANCNSSGRDNNHPVPILAELHGSLNNKSNDRKKWLPGLFINNGATAYVEFQKISCRSL